MAAADYGYDADGNVISRLLTLPGNAATGLHTYDYDRAGRLTQWDAPNLAAVAYTWDASGNRTGAGTDTYTYDERNRLTSGPDGTYTHTPRGTLTSITDGGNTTTYGFDALGRLVDYDGTVTYSYDTLDRIATRDTDSFEYTGVWLDPTDDGSFTYLRSPGGRLITQTDGATALFTGHDRHGDLTWLLDPTTSAITDTQVYDPYGDPHATTGNTAPTVGFQGDYTDPTTGETWMGARWYSATDAAFRSRDTIHGELRTPISLNRYTYGFANPVGYWDPDGRWPSWSDITQGVSTIGRNAVSTLSQAGSAIANSSAYQTATAIGGAAIDTAYETIRVDNKWVPETASLFANVGSEAWNGNFDPARQLASAAVEGFTNQLGAALSGDTDALGAFLGEFALGGLAGRLGQAARLAPDGSPTLLATAGRTHHRIDIADPPTPRAGQPGGGASATAARPVVASSQRNIPTHTRNTDLTTTSPGANLPNRTITLDTDGNTIVAPTLDAGPHVGRGVHPTTDFDSKPQPVLDAIQARGAAAQAPQARFVVGSDGTVTDLVSSPPDAISLGHYPDYSDLAARTGARTFSIPDEAWDRMSNPEQWIRNRRFLDDAVANGSEIWLATPLDAVRPGSGFERELQYLLSRGLVPNTAGTAMIPGAP